MKTQQPKNTSRRDFLSVGLVLAGASLAFLNKRSSKRCTSQSGRKQELIDSHFRKESV